MSTKMDYIEDNKNGIEVTPDERGWESSGPMTTGETYITHGRYWNTYPFEDK